MSEEALDRFEVARIIGARALQLSFGAPPLVEVGKGMVDALELARIEFENDIVPLRVIRQ